MRKVSWTPRKTLHVIGSKTCALTMFFLMAFWPARSFAQSHIKKQPVSQWSEPNLREDCRINSSSITRTMISLAQSANLGPILSVTSKKLKVRPNLKVVLMTSSGMPVEAVILNDKSQFDSGENVTITIQIPDSFWEVFAKSTFLKIRVGKKLIVNLPLTDPQLAVSNLKICDQLRLKRDETRREFREKMINRRPNSPAVLRMEWLEAEVSRYPSRALQRGHEGEVEMALKIGVDGVVTACDVKKSSGHPELDAASCSGYLNQAAFWPAIGANGQPIESEIMRGVRWVIPN